MRDFHQFLCHLFLAFYFALWCCNGVRDDDIGEPEVHCELPASVVGRWQDLRAQRFTIQQRGIQEIGPCVHQGSDNVILYSRSERCYMCVQFDTRHINTIHVQVGSCPVPSYMGFTTCRLPSSIRLPSLLLRENAFPVKCPFKGSYRYSYANGSSSICSSPLSTMTSCAAVSQYYFRFRPCEHVPSSQERDMTLTCVATWEMNGRGYLIARLNEGNTSRDQVHCLEYHHMENGFQVQSVSTKNCARVSSSKGRTSLEINMTKDDSGSVSPRCVLPDWFGGHSWRDLSGQLVVTADKLNTQLFFSRRQTLAQVPTSTARFSCLSITSRNNTHLTMLTHATHGCQPGRQCVQIIRRLRDVLEIHTGKIGNSTDDSCPETEFDGLEGNSFLIFPDHLVGTLCPLPKGHYKVVGSSGSPCTVSLQSQCSSTSRMAVYHRCTSAVTVSRFTCLKQWTSGSRPMLVMRRDDDASGTANCMTIRRRGDVIVFAPDKSCNLAVKSVLPELKKLTLSSAPGICRTIRPVVQPSQADSGDALCKSPCHPESRGHLALSPASETVDKERVRPTVTLGTSTTRSRSWCFLVLIVLFVTL